MLNTFCRVTWGTLQWLRGQIFQSNSALHKWAGTGASNTLRRKKEEKQEQAWDSLL